MVVEHWPRGLALTAPHAPDWVAALRDLPEAQGVLVDLDEFDTWLMYYQTVYRKPQAFGYVSRAPASVGEKNDRLRHLYRTGQYDVLRDELHFRYLVARPGSPLPLTPVYGDSQATIYDLARDDKPY